MSAAVPWLRRAQPLLGTLVEIGVHDPRGNRQGSVDAAFAAVRDTQTALSRFDARSDVSRFARLRRGERMAVRQVTREVLVAAADLHAASAGTFDVTLGSAPAGWALVGAELHKLRDETRIDLGGIGKGHAVDLAVQVLIAEGCASGWVNAGGDLRAFGDLDAPVHLRVEQTGGVRPFALLRDGAFATSHFGLGSRSQLAAGAGEAATAEGAHASVAAPLCLWADALTKVVALSGDIAQPALLRLLARYDARAWLH